ncbi:DUF4192 family protein [Tessaracoccus terricola]
MNPTTTLRCSGAQDLLALPSLLLEFQPTESVVAVCLRSNIVQFCARSDLDLDDESVAETAAQVMRGFRNTRGREIVLLGYGRDLARVREAIVALRSRLEGVVTVALAASNGRYWELEDDQLPSHDGEPYSTADSALAARAVFEGLQVARTREEAVAAVRRPPANLLPGITERMDTAMQRVLPLDPDDRIALFEELVERDEALLPDEAAELAAVLTDEECQAEFLCQVNTSTAGRFHARLLEARAAADEECEAAVLAPLAIASWLYGKGAQMNECVAQLAELEPRHPVLRMLDVMLTDAVPPSHWDTWEGR